ncbi:hypothetical protein KFJ24_02715 [Marinobacter sediminum]|uniref:hypothetical protein n=1 Tax=Marinobacter sediminum TaxID=256323 RepID=UPI00202F2FA4|nr:hypothetical protein [Marinobacter sediminum]MCM0611387.1 hypothetical protein [Marinobacter sediminum]
MGALRHDLSRRFLAVITLVLALTMTGCQSLLQPPSKARAEQAVDGKEAVNPEYSRQLRRINLALAESSSGGLPADEVAFARRAGQLRAVGHDFLKLTQSGPVTGPEYRLWGDFFNRLSDTVEVVVGGQANLVDAEQLYELAAQLYPLFIDRSHLPERPFIAVDGETSAYYAGNYYLCTMPEVIADGYGRRRAEGMSEHLGRAMERYLDGPCEPDLMFSAAEMLYDYALVAGPDQAAYRDRIEKAGPGKSAPWLILLDNFSLAHNQQQALANLEQALAAARADLDSGDEISLEFANEVERQRTLLTQDQRPLRVLQYRP